ncbi:MAG TPA: hypothetical protein ENI58_02990 [Nitrospirae bacterium]|nr:hypothetical protein [Nitrospirota bacterium]
MGKRNFVENIYNVYCDESRVENPESNRMVIGALEVLRKEAPAIKTHLKDIYKKHDLKYELNRIR